jgi:hypothetical protein
MTEIQLGIEMNAGGKRYESTAVVLADENGRIPARFALLAVDQLAAELRRSVGRVCEGKTPDSND